jgi:glycosyltransferase involved in cell wall biosynthesis
MTPTSVIFPFALGLTTGGVQLWAARCASALAHRGHRVAAILHAPPSNADLASTPLDLHPSIIRIDATHLGPLANADPNATAALYTSTADSLSSASNTPIVCIPTLLAECFTAATAAAAQRPSTLRLLGCCHSAVPYDLNLHTRFAPALHSIGAVSQFLANELRAALPHRTNSIFHLPNGVAVQPHFRARPLSHSANRPLHLVFLGRLEDENKRVSALLSLSDVLTSHALPHRITIIGDGPAQATLSAAIQHRPITLTGALPPSQIPVLLDDADFLVLPSRIEGLNLALLESMSRGCIPLITHTPSGAAEVVTHNHNGLLVSVPAAADPTTTGQLLAAALLSSPAATNHTARATLSAAAHRTILDRYSFDHSINILEHAILQTANAPEIHLSPAELASIHTNPAAPPHAAAALHTLLTALAGQRVVIHGTGRHTQELLHVLAAHAHTIVGFTDDDPQRHGGTLLLSTTPRPIVAPTQAHTLNATDVIISSHLNQSLIQQRSGPIYAAQSITLHALYPN